MDREQLVEAIKREIATTKARFTAGDWVTEELIDAHYQMPSTERYARASANAIEQAGFAIVPVEAWLLFEKAYSGKILCDADFVKARAMIEEGRV